MWFASDSALTLMHDGWDCVFEFTPAMDLESVVKTMVVCTQPRARSTLEMIVSELEEHGKPTPDQVLRGWERIWMGCCSNVEACCDAARNGDHDQLVTALTQLMRCTHFECKKLGWRKEKQA